MTSPSNPVNIRAKSPLNADDSLSTTPVGGTPDVRTLRAQYTAMGTPPPNIPPRVLSSTAKSGSPTALVFTPTASQDPLPVGEISASSSGASGSPDNLAEATGPLDMDNLPEEEKLKVLRRHLVSKSERQPQDSSPSSRHSSSSNVAALKPFREDSEPFPIPYHASGADITCVFAEI